jgi:hypothetical protein
MTGFHACQFHCAYDDRKYAMSVLERHPIAERGHMTDYGVSFVLDLSRVGSEAKCFEGVILREMQRAVSEHRHA